jgi:serine/threonine protein kinase
MSFWNLPSQVIFSHNQYKVVADIAAGVADIGMVRTDFLESLQLPFPFCNDTAQAALGLGCFPDGTFKVLDARSYPDYPFPGGTQLYPEWPIGALSHISPDVQKAVAAALFALGTSSSTLQYTDAARISTFTPPMSYMGIRDMLHTQNWIINNTCIKSTQIYDTILCMPGSFRLSPQAVNASCAANGLPCPAGYSCVCSPCEVLHEDPLTITIAISTAPANVSECIELQVCVEGTQNAPFIVTLTDNWFNARDELGLAPVGAVSFKMDTSMADRDASWLPASSGGDGTWTVIMETPHTGLSILELAIDGVPQSSRHTFVSVVPPVCTGRNAAPSLAGYCECPTAYVASGDNGDCVPGRGLVLAAAVGSTVGTVGLVLLIVAALFFARRRAEALWRIPNSAVTFTDPPEVLGRGTFGLVVKGTYRGTTVALKRSLPMEPRGSRSGSLTSRGTGTFTSIRIRSSSGGGSVSGLHSLDSAQGVVNADVSSTSFDMRPTASSSGGLMSPSRFSSLADASVHLSARSNNRTSVFDAPAAPVAAARRPSIDEEAATRGQPSRSHSSSAGLQHTTQSSSVLPEACATKCGLLDELLGITAQRRRAASLRADFVREMRLLVHLRHPHILTVLGAVLHDAEPLLVMEYMGRGSLHDLLHNETLPLDGNVVLRLLRDVVSGIEFLHSASPPILHNDIKSANILVDANFRAKVSDFGLSGKRRASRGPPGTPFWMAPELLRRKGQPSTASDVYSFGITLCEVFNRAEPYAEQDMSMKEVLARVAASSGPGGTPPLRPVVGASVPSAFATLMRRCWHAEAAMRPTMGAISAELRIAANDEDAGAGMVTAALQAAKHRHTAESKLLNSLFPPAVAAALAEGRRVEPQEFGCVTVFFSGALAHV